MKDPRAVILAPFLLLPVALAAGQKTPVPALTEEHWNASKTVGFKTPAGWSVTHAPGDMELTEARGDGMILRIWRREGEFGLDSLHVECMMRRLADTMSGVMR